MREAANQEGRFQDAYLRVKEDVDAHLSLPNVVPVPKDGGGGYTHERHKKNKSTPDAESANREIFPVVSVTKKSKQWTS